MIDKDRLAAAGAIIGAPARAAIVAQLADGRAQTATELSIAAGVTQQTASSHLQKLSDAGFIIQEKRGRHRYFRLAAPEISSAMETLSGLVDKKPKPAQRRNRALEKLKPARLCYDHLAGSLGARITQAMVQKGYLWPEGEDHKITRSGDIFFNDLGIDTQGLARKRRLLAPLCADWSVETPHIGGSLGAALTEVYLGEGWLVQARRGRGLTITPDGEAAFTRLFGINVHGDASAGEDAD